MRSVPEIDWIDISYLSFIAGLIAMAVGLPFFYLWDFSLSFSLSFLAFLMGVFAAFGIIIWRFFAPVDSLKISICAAELGCFIMLLVPVFVIYPKLLVVLLPLGILISAIVGFLIWQFRTKFDLVVFFEPRQK